MANRRILTDDDLVDIKSTVIQVVETEAKDAVEEAIDTALEELDISEVVKEAAVMKWQIID
jgi:hypothetical protein